MKMGTLSYNRDTGRYDIIDGTGLVVVDGLHCGDVFDVYEAEIHIYAGDQDRANEADREKRWISARIESDFDDTWFLVIDGEAKLGERDPGDKRLHGLVVRV